MKNMRFFDRTFAILAPLDRFLGGFLRWAYQLILFYKHRSEPM